MHNKKIILKYYGVKYFRTLPNSCNFSFITHNLVIFDELFLYFFINSHFLNEYNYK